jgi:RNA polymerase sigma-70 factor (TIGR02960 family)
MGFGSDKPGMSERADEFLGAPRHIGMTHTTQHVVAPTSRFVNGTELTAGLADAAEFGALAERYRRELHVHCYRMLGSFDEAEDLLQETFFRGWRARGTFQGHASPRAWMYRIATNACLDFLRRNPRKAHVKRDGDGSEFVEVTWMQPYPDTLLDEVGPSEAEPDAVVVKRESIELAFLTAIQLLPPRQRAVLLLCDVLDWSAAEVAAWLETSVASINSALQRARATLQRERGGRPSAPTDEQRVLLRKYIEATDRADIEAFVALVHEDVLNTMPPEPEFIYGHAAMRQALQEAFDTQTFGQFRCIETWANRQPTAACYLRKPGESEFRAFALDVLRVEQGKVVEVTSFINEAAFAAFGLPSVL